MLIRTVGLINFLTMITENNISDWAERYIDHQLNSDEGHMLDMALQNDAALKASFEASVDLIRMLRSSGEQQAMRQMMAEVATDRKAWAAEYEKTPRQLSFRKYLRTGAVAAGLVMLSSLATYFAMNKGSQNSNNQQYTLLRRELESIKHSQSKIIDSLSKDKEPQDQHPARFGGTGFALTNDGYVATNFHVVKDANNIFVQTNDGETYSAYIIARDPAADVAILKVEDKHFRFSKSALPYAIAKSTSGLGQRVFSLGYPQEDPVYNEGYISSENGYNGDIQSYQLEITANPGQSGAPILDKNGTVIAVITGKQSNTAGTTYAVHALALHNLIRTLPPENTIRLSENNRLSRLDRTEQVKKLRDFVCAVKVN